VLNEAHILAATVAKLRAFLQEHLTERWQIVIVDNGSEDGTDAVAARLSSTYSDVRFITLSQRGRGRALRAAWLQTTCDVMCYMDVDLSTDLRHLPELIGAVLRDGYDLATGSRLLPDSVTKRSFKREFISRVYNIFVKTVLFTGFSDAQCGFKAISREVAERIIPQIEDQSWFFDTELLVLAEKQGFRIKDIPVIWTEDDDSRVKIVQTAWDDIKGVLRLRRQLWLQKLHHPAITALKRR
jgi:glycosyltransferase involved in cell wall biosynthesis